MSLKVSEITEKDIIQYLRLTEVDEVEKTFIRGTIDASKNYIVNYTGLTEEQLDSYADLSVVVFILCSDLYDNRSLYVDKNNINKTVESILNLHARNLI